ncbi:MAG: caspase family protein, partial [Elusimicrobia bacterium]|nr:caspase family protein [Elusimicrobiota bacterium]
MMKRLALAWIAASLGAAGCASTPLTAAVKARDLSQVKALVEGGADINKRDSMGPISSPLGYAARYNSPEIATYLVSKGAYDQQAVITYAAYNNLVDVVQAMLAAGSDKPEMGLINMRGESLVDRHGKRLAAQAPPAVAAAPAAPQTPPMKPAIVSDVDSPARRGAERLDDFALVIGIEDYQSLPKADYGARDAATVRKHLEALGVPARNIISLEGSQATGSKLKNYLQQWLPRNVKPESTVFVYYSGHGAPDPENGDAYLVPWDADPMFLTTSAYPLKQFYAELAKFKAKRVVVALDACFSGSGGRSVLAKGARPLVAKVDESVPSAANLTVLAAASGAEITGSLDEQGHGIFT